MFDNIPNPNDHFLWGNAFKNTYRGNNSGSPTIKQGKIVNVTRQNHLAQTYDVEELESGALLTGCKYISPTGGFNGTGNFSPLEEGTPVTITCANGQWDEVFITGVFYTEGNYDKYYQDGDLQKPGDIEESLEFNQTPSHPNWIVDPNSTITLYGVNNLYDDFMSPEFTDNLEDKAKSNKQPGVIDLATSVGDKVNYALNTIVNYTSNIINVAEGTAETKCAKLVDFANYYNKQADLLAQTSIIKETPKEEAKKTTGLKPIVTKQSNSKNQGSLRSPFTNQYFIDQYRKLAQMYLEQAQACNRGDAARQLVGLQMQAALGSEQPQTNSTEGLEGQQTKPDYKPKEEKAKVAEENYGDRTQTGFKPLIVLHETIGNAISVNNLFQNPKAQVSYHVMIKLDGTLVYFTDPKKRAFGASPSQFNGEFETRKRDDGKVVRSVNSFAYHISFETPLDGQGINGAKANHSGFTQPQYNSLAWLTAKTGVPLERITTHQFVDIGQGKQDPRSFDRAKFEKLWNNYPKSKEIWFGINGEDEWIKSIQNTPQIATSNNLIDSAKDPAPKSTLAIYKERYSRAFGSQYTGGKPSYSDWVALFRKEAEVSNASTNRIKNVIIGDSITLGFPPELLNNKVLNQGISGESSLGLSKRVNTLIAAAPTKVFIMIGINDLLNLRSPESVISNIETTVREFKKVYPNSKVYVQSTLPKAIVEEVTASNKAYKDKILNAQNKDVRTINSYLKANQNGFTFLDIASQLDNSQGGINKWFTTDGVHLSYSGYRAWANIIRKLLD